jgi:hypothetical protein
MIKSYRARPFTKFIMLTQLITIPPWGMEMQKRRRRKGAIMVS